MYKEDILPGLGHDYYLVLTRNENGRKYSYYTGFSNDCSLELKAKYTAGVPCGKEVPGWILETPRRSRKWECQ